MHHPNKFGDENVQNVVVTLDDGTEEKIYFPEGEQPYVTLQRGDIVAVLFDEGKKQIVFQRESLLAAAPFEPQTQHQASVLVLTDDMKTNIEARMQALAHCIETARKTYPQADLTDIREFAATVFNSLSAS